jgi:hypothetical protein
MPLILLLPLSQPSDHVLCIHLDRPYRFTPRPAVRGDAEAIEQFSSLGGDNGLEKNAR